MSKLSQDTKLLIGGGIGIAALAYFTRRRTRDQGGFASVHAPREHREHERGEYGKKHHHHHEES